MESCFIYLLQTDIISCWEIQDRVRQLVAELNDLEHQVAEVQDEYAKEKEIVIAEAETDAKQLIEEIELFRLNAVLHEKEDTIQWLEENLRTTKAISEDMSDVSAQLLQKEHDAQEEVLRRLKQQHQNEVAELKAKVRAA